LSDRSLSDAALSDPALSDTALSDAALSDAALSERGLECAALRCTSSMECTALSDWSTSRSSRMSQLRTCQHATERRELSSKSEQCISHGQSARTSGRDGVREGCRRAYPRCMGIEQRVGYGRPVRDSGRGLSVSCASAQAPPSQRQSEQRAGIKAPGSFRTQEGAARMREGTHRAGSAAQRRRPPNENRQGTLSPPAALAPRLRSISCLLPPVAKLANTC
jgi:hypothetical protein